MEPEYWVMIIFGVFFYVLVPMTILGWAILHWLKKQRRKSHCGNAYRQAEHALEARLRDLLRTGMALDADLWLKNDGDGLSDAFFELLFRASQHNAPVLLPAAVKRMIVESTSTDQNSVMARKRLDKFQRAGLLLTHKDEQALRLEDCPAIICGNTMDDDLFRRKIDYHGLTEELRNACREWQLANIH